MAIGVNTATTNATQIKVGDSGSLITITMENIENVDVNDLDYVRLYNGDKVTIEEHIEVTDIEVADNVLKLRLPYVPSGKWNLEIMDVTGRIYPAEGVLQLRLLGSTIEGKEVTYVSYKEEIINELPAVVMEFMTANVEEFRGVQGEKGDTVVNPPKMFTRDEFDQLPEKDPNTLYFIESAPVADTGGVAE